MRWWLTAVVACYSPVTLQPGDGDGGVIDADLDSHGTGDAAFCTDGRLGVLECLPGGLTTTTVQIGSTDDLACEGTDKPYCLITGFDVAIRGDAVGSRPLVVIAVHDVTVASGTVLSASSSRIVQGGGAGSAQCTFAKAPVGGGGGAGGSFATIGGGGGASVGGLGGLAPAMKAPPSQLEAGCPGQSGASGNGALGGGVIMLIAGHEIIVSGTVSANGAGGNPGGLQAGGDGGGAGGLIALDAPVIDFDGGSMFARGGGGGGGGSTSGFGMPGTDGNAGADTGSGGGGAVGGGAAGGDGAHDGGAPGGGASSTTSGGGGGGGGGSVGYLLYRGQLGFNGAPMIDPGLTEMP